MKSLQELNKANDVVFWRRAEALSKLKTGNLWKFVYGDEGTWAQFCSHELKMPVSSADQKVATYEFFVKKHAFSFKELVPYDTNTLYYIGRYMKDEKKTKVLERMEQSKDIGRDDIIKQLRGDDDCPHPHTHNENETKVVCDECNRVLAKKKK